VSRLSDIAATGAITLAKGRATTGGTVDIRREYMGLDLATVGRGHRSNPTGAKNTARTIATDARQAIEAFLAAMAEEMDDGPLAFKLWAHSYDKMRASEGWPPVSEKVLSLAMQAAGCRRREIDRRKQGRGRYIAFELPRRSE
jgi:hypothetical protein